MSFTFLHHFVSSKNVQKNKRLGFFLPVVTFPSSKSLTACWRVKDFILRMNNEKNCAYLGDLIGDPVGHFGYDWKPGWLVWMSAHWRSGKCSGIGMIRTCCHMDYYRMDSIHYWLQIHDWIQNPTFSHCHSDDRDLPGLNCSNCGWSTSCSRWFCHQWPRNNSNVDFGIEIGIRRWHGPHPTVRNP